MNCWIRLSKTYRVHKKVFKCNYCASVPPLLINIGGSSLPGRSHGIDNEDRYDIIKFSRNIQYFSVFDGHNGAFASDYVNTLMPRLIEEKLASTYTLYDAVFEELNNIMLSCFEKCQECLATAITENENMKRKEMVGTTAVVGVLVDNQYLTIANVGDSKAILCRDGKAIELTVEHIPTNPEESLRIEQCGGWIDWDSRFKPLVDGRLSMTRSLGNLLLKPNIVPSKPSIKHTNLNEFHDSFLVLCTDGITHSISNDEIIYIVSQHDNAIEAAEDLTNTAYHYGSDDDVTAVVIPFGAWRNIEVKRYQQNYSMFKTFVGGRYGG